LQCKTQPVTTTTSIPSARGSGRQREDETGGDILIENDAHVLTFSAGQHTRRLRRAQNLSPRSAAAPTLPIMTLDYVIRPETPADHRAVRDTHALAFGDPDRVPDLVDALRAAPAALAPVSLVATCDDRVVGHVMLSACRLDAPARLVDVFSLSPLGVHPDHQRRGLGGRLIAQALAAADERGMPLVFLEGSPVYYARHGFSRASAAGFRAPSLRIPDPAFQVAKLAAYEEWMEGSFVYSETFWAQDCVGLRDPERAARIAATG
jgi:putative acetyltransferase